MHPQVCGGCACVYKDIYVRICINIYILKESDLKSQYITKRHNLFKRFYLETRISSHLTVSCY